MHFVQYPLVLPPVINSCVIFLIQDVGCDFKIGSGAQEDICGVCKGNGTSCRTVEGRFNQLAGSGNPAEKKKKKKTYEELNHGCSLHVMAPGEGKVIKV